jgi:Outer membrane protein beta-barrel domain
MKLTRVIMAMLIGGLAGLLHAGTAAAQTEDPINIFVVDVRGSLMSFDKSALGTSLGVTKEQLPTRGLGLELGAHVYPIRGKVIALGLGASVLFSRGTEKPDTPEGATAPPPGQPTVQTRVRAFTPQVSLNFGSKRGYSYISGGIGSLIRTYEATEGTMVEVNDDTRARTLNYGGGARWFASSHVAFTFDIRFYRVNAQDATPTSAKLPQQRFLAASGGISIH